MYGLTEAFRSTYLDPAEVDRRPDFDRQGDPRTPRSSWCGPTARRAIRAKRASWCTAARWSRMGYWNDPERTAERFRPAPGRDAAWRTPGDRGLVRATLSSPTRRAILYFVGRKDEMIKTSGYRVSPTEIEEVAYATGLVRDAVALGVEDAQARSAHRAGRQPGRIKMELDADALIAAMKRRLPLYMVPAVVVVRDEIPRSPNGKFDRRCCGRSSAS